MNKQEICKATIELYTEFFRQVTLNKNYTFIRFGRDIIQIGRFADWMLTQYKPEQIGITFLIDFFKFQFSRYAGVNTAYGRNAIMIHWLIGNKARQAWLNQKHSKKWLVKFKLKKEVELRLIDAFKEQLKKQSNTKAIKRHKKVHLHEEVEKKRFYNTKKGFLYCHGTTTLYNKKSALCEGCKFKTDCIISLKNQFPELHKIRISDDR